VIAPNDVQSLLILVLWLNHIPKCLLQLTLFLILLIALDCVFMSECSGTLNRSQEVQIGWICYIIWTWLSRYPEVWLFHILWLINACLLSHLLHTLQIAPEILQCHCLLWIHEITSSSAHSILYFGIDQLLLNVLTDLLLHVILVILIVAH
jgi:hypothetical protein